MAIVPENRRLFGDMSVRENLEMGATLRRGENLREDFEKVHSLFPRLYERRDQLACTLSGGRAANGGDGPGPDVPPAPAADGRAVNGFSACAGTAELRDHQAGPRSGRGGADGRAERDDGAVDSGPRLCAGDGRDRAGRQGG